MTQLTERTCATCRWRRRDKFTATWERTHIMVICDHEQAGRLVMRDACCLFWEPQLMPDA
jgi:hypothetical protein